jgi:hypothetical protein
MNPLNPPESLVMLSHEIWMRYDVYIPPYAWSIAAGCLFMLGLVVVNRLLHVWLSLPE